jgi:hypothetical protein
VRHQIRQHNGYRARYAGQAVHQDAFFLRPTFVCNNKKVWFRPRSWQTQQLFDHQDLVKIQPSPVDADQTGKGGEHTNNIINTWSCTRFRLEAFPSVRVHYNFILLLLINE